MWHVGKTMPWLPPMTSWECFLHSTKQNMVIFLGDDGFDDGFMMVYGIV
jgi:hypothetical protein